MRIVSWNDNGIRAVQRKGLWEPFLADIAPDVICLQEIKADRSQVDVPLEGFHEIWHSAEKKGYSGTAIFSRIEPVSV